MKLFATKFNDGVIPTQPPPPPPPQSWPWVLPFPQSTSKFWLWIRSFPTRTPVKKPNPANLDVLSTRKQATPQIPRFRGLGTTRNCRHVKHRRHRCERHFECRKRCKKPMQSASRFCAFSQRRSQKQLQDPTTPGRSSRA